MEDFTKEYKLERMNSYAGTKVTERSYNLTIGLTLLWGVLINVVMSVFFTYQILSLNYLLVLAVYFVGTIGCSIIVHRTSNAAIGFIAFTGMAFCMGLLLTYYVYAFTAHSVAYAFLATALVTIIMVLLSMLYPGFFLSLGRTLFVSLIVCVIAQTVVGLVFRMPLNGLDYVISLIFCGYIGFDWARAQIYPKTANNAVACASDIYLDCVNLFIRILSIVGNRRD